MSRCSLIALLASVSLTHADLSWEKPVQEFHCVPEDKAVTAHFAFKNSGGDPLTIKKVTTSCGCTSAKLAKNTFAPGESGDIEVKFSFGMRRGPQRKIISVTGENGEEWRLDLRCWIHQPLTISPALVYWRSGEPADSKTVKLTSAPGQAVEIKSVKSSSPEIKASISTVKAGEEYAIAVTPKDTGSPKSAELTVETASPNDVARSYKVFVRVK